MARGKRKKKKSSQTNCEISSQEMDSHGTTTNDGQNPATTECICLSKSQKIRRFLLCCIATETPYCPIHTSESSNVMQNTKPRKAEKGTSKQPSRIRRIGRWLIKKVTKGKKEEHTPNEPIELTSATVCINPDEPPRLQLLCQHVLSVDGLEDTTQANKANDISVESESVSVTVVTVDVDESEPSSYDVNHKSDNASVQSLKELCIEAIEYADNVKPDVSGTLEDQTDEKELDEVDDNAEEKTIINLECIRNQEWPMTEDCTIEIENAPTMRISIYDAEQEQAYCKDQEDSNESEPNSYDVNHKSDNASVQSLKELCLEAIEYADDVIPDVSGTLEDQTGEKELNEVDDNAEETTVINLDCIRNQAWPMTEDCTIAIENAPTMRISISDTEQEQAYCKDQEDSNKSEPSSYDINLKSDDTSTQALEELCLEVIGNADDVKTIGGDTLEDQTGDKDVNEVTDSTEENMEINPEYERNEAKSLAELCVAAIRNAGDVKTDINDTEKGHDYGRKQDKEFDTDADTVKINLEIGSNVVKYLEYLISVAVRNVDDMKNNIHDTNQEQAYDKYEEESNDFELDNYEINLKYDYVSTMFLKEPWMKAIRDDDVKTGINDTEEDQAECKIKNKAYDTKAHTFEINPERGKNVSMTLTELEQKYLTDNTDMNKTNITKQAHDRERTKESNENKAKYQPNDTGQVQATETVADRGSHIKQDSATGNMNNTADTADTKADAVEKDNTKDNKKDSTTETAHTTENDHQNVNTGGYIPGLFLHVPVEELFQMILGVYNEGRCNTRTKHGNKGMMQRELNYRISMDQGISNHDVKAHADKEHIPRNRNEKRIRRRKCKIGHVDSNTGGNDCTDSDANKRRNPTTEIGVGARPKKRNLANENMIQAALKKTHDEAAIQSDCVVTGSKAATNISASEAKRHVRRRQRKEAKPYTGGEHEPQPKPEPKLLSESPTEQKKDTTPCIDTGSSNIEISHRTHRKKKQKRRKAKWY